jgi:hypothetical protein
MCHLKQQQACRAAAILWGLLALLPGKGRAWA